MYLLYLTTKENVMDNLYKDNYRLEYLSQIEVTVRTSFIGSLDNPSSNKTGFKIMTEHGPADVLIVSGLESSGDGTFLKTMNGLIMVRLMSGCNDSATVDLTAHLNSVATESLSKIMVEVTDYVEAVNACFKSLYAWRPSETVSMLPKLEKRISIPLTERYALSLNISTAVVGYTSFGVINTGLEVVR
jgi:hypothetical protein